MHGEIRIFSNKELDFQVRTILNSDGSVLINAEDAAVGFGWNRTEVKNGKEYTSVMWSRMNGYCKELGFAHECAKDDYIPESLYYLLGMKANNERAQKYQRWLAMDVLPSLRKTGSYVMQNQKQSTDDRINIMDMNARSRMANMYMKLAQVDTLSSTYKNILVSKASEVLAGEAVIPLPAVEQKKSYTAKEIGDLFGISANKVGRIANQHNLKTEPFGEYRRDKSRYSAHECDAFVYFDTVIPEFEKILGREVA